MEQTNCWVESMTTVALSKRVFEEATRLQSFWNDNYARLLAVYPEQYVAIDLASREVLAADRELTNLVECLRDEGRDPAESVAIQFISAHSASINL